MRWPHPSSDFGGCSHSPPCRCSSSPSSPARYEPERFIVSAAAGNQARPVVGALGPAFRRRIITISAISFVIAVMTGPANSFIFIYGQNVLHVSGVAIAAVVIGAGATGLVGLICGQALADRVGRRVTGAVAMVAMAFCGMLTYSGSHPAFFCGYLLAVLAAAVFAPAAGALANELFPTSVRASVAGWELVASVLGGASGLLIFGAVADVGNRFSVAAIVTFAVAIPAAALFAAVPETRGRELEDVLTPSPG